MGFKQDTDSPNVYSKRPEYNPKLFDIQKNEENTNLLWKRQLKDANAQMIKIAAIIKMLSEVRALILKTHGNGFRKEIGLTERRTKWKFKN